MARIAYLCTDLLFTSKIRETARSLGHDVAAARDLAALPAAVRGARAVIIDLRLPQAIAALELLRGDPATEGVPAIGFCDHERLELMDRAREAGCAKVLAKGKFSSELQALLREEG